VNVIASRSLVLRSDEGDAVVSVKIGAPVPLASGEDWECAYQVWVAEKCIKGSSHGIDSLQALQLSIGTLDVELRHATKMHGGVLMHHDEPFTSLLDGSGMQFKSSSQA
jgi:hypothetical protein